jgi:hypothetical protein
MARAELRAVMSRRPGIFVGVFVAVAVAIAVANGWIG